MNALTGVLMPVQPGTLLGRYEILSPLGAGGMGEVYCARDSTLGRKVAIKILAGRLTENAEALRRFEKEAKALASLSHPNILEIHDFGKESGIVYAVTELLDGQTLRARITKSPLAQPQALEIAIAVAEGLAAAHSRGVIHRDLKPENIFISSDGRIKILDFGLARFKPQQSIQELSKAATVSQLTREGMVLGTVPYLSPEQVKGEQADERSDIFSFGCLVYEMLTGRLPFSGSNSAEIMASILRDDPPELPDDISPALVHVVSRCLKKDPRQRFQAAPELAFSLKEASGASTRIRQASLLLRHKRNASRFLTAGISGILILITLLILIRDQLADRMSIGKIESIAVLPLQNLSPDPKQEYFADGMTEELIATLARIESVRVVSRSSVMEYKGKHKKISKVGKELNVDAVVEGSVLHAGERVRITAQLIRVSDDRHLWAQTYERDLRDILALQNEVAASIVEQIQAKLTPAEEVHLANVTQVNPDAYQAFLQGIHYSSRPNISEDDIRMAIRMFERAVELDPKFSRAYARLSEEHSYMYHIGYDRTKTRLESARKAADLAFQVQPGLPEGHMALGYYYYLGYKDHDQALKEFSIAQENLQHDKHLLEGIAYVLRRAGKFGEALAIQKELVKLAPREADVLNNLGFTLMRMRRYQEAQLYYDRAISVAPDQTVPYALKAWTYMQWSGAIEPAKKTIQEMPEKKDPYSTRLIFWIYVLEKNYEGGLHLLQTSGYERFVSLDYFEPKDQLAGIVYQLRNEPENARASYDSARVALEKELRERPDDPRIYGSLGIVYAGLGLKEQAITAGNRAVELYPVENDTLSAPTLVENLARVYVMTDEHDLALDQVDYLLSIPSWLSAPLLEIDPRWDPLRKHPRFQELLQKYRRQS